MSAQPAIEELLERFMKEDNDGIMDGIIPSCDKAIAAHNDVGPSPTTPLPPAITPTTPLSPAISTTKKRNREEKEDPAPAAKREGLTQLDVFARLAEETKKAFDEYASAVIESMKL